MKKIFHLLINFFDDTNPILIKECRQLVRSKSFSLLIYGEILSFLAISIPIFKSTNYDGQSFFWGFFICMLIATTIISYLTAWKTSKECSIKNQDLLFLTALTPKKYITGKIIFNLIQTSLIFTTGLPFIFLCYIVGAVSPYLILKTFITLFGCIFLFSNIMTLFAIIPIGNKARMNLLITGFIGFELLQILFFDIVYGFLGFFPFYKPIFNFSSYFIILIVFFCFNYSLNTLSCFLLTPPNDQRSLISRSKILINILIIICGYSFYIFLIPKSGDQSQYKIITILTFFSLAFINLMILFMGLATTQFYKQINQNKKTIIQKFLSFLFIDSSLNAYTLYFIIGSFLTTYLYVFQYVFISLKNFFFDKQFLPIYGLAILYPLSYILLAHLFQNLLKKINFFFTPLTILHGIIVFSIFIDILSSALVKNPNSTFIPGTISSLVIIGGNEQNFSYIMINLISSLIIIGSSTIYLLKENKNNIKRQL